MKVKNTAIKTVEKSLLYSKIILLLRSVPFLVDPLAHFAGPETFSVTDYSAAELSTVVIYLLVHTINCARDHLDLKPAEQLHYSHNSKLQCNYISTKH